MAVETSLPVLFNTLTQSLSLAFDAAPESSSLLPPKDGISLLDIKNDLLLAYLQNLVFLIILKLRGRNNESEVSDGEHINNAVITKLVELRLYLEKGVRPIEGRLKYQIDKVLRAADDFTRTSAPVASHKVTKQTKSSNNNGEDETDDLDDSDAKSTDGVRLKASEIDDLQYKPQPSSLVRPSERTTDTSISSVKEGLYRPPRINATAMSTTHPRDKEVRRNQKSATLDEFINTEVSSAPLAEPSIGSTIVSGGRRSKSERERKDEAERREYEEMNFVRLPNESKKERAKKSSRRRDAGYGGEEWRGLGEGIDRIERLTKRKSGDGRSGVLEKSRKRATEDRPRGKDVTAEMGQGFQKRLKTLDGVRRDRGKK